MKKEKKTRLDQLLVNRDLAASIKEAEALIRAGKVIVDDARVEKPGALFANGVIVKRVGKKQFVSRGGHKLQTALDHFGINPSGWVCADVGASTGGFTDCLLQAGAKHVFAIDVAYGQLDWELRNDSRVTVLERLNVRKISRSHLSQPLDLVVFDTSFISLKLVIPPLLPFLKKTWRLVALIKPQFELPREKIPPGGVVKDKILQLQAVEMIKAFADSLKLETKGVTPSAIRGPKGNQEFLIYLTRSND